MAVCNTGAAQGQGTKLAVLEGAGPGRVGFECDASKWTSAVGGEKITTGGDSPGRESSFLQGQEGRARREIEAGPRWLPGGGRRIFFKYEGCRSRDNPAGRSILLGGSRRIIGGVTNGNGHTHFVSRGMAGTKRRFKQLREKPDPAQPTVTGTVPC